MVFLVKCVLSVKTKKLKSAESGLYAASFTSSGPRAINWEEGVRGFWRVRKSKAGS